MAVIRIDNFAGEFPSASPRALGGNGAQANRNLLLTTNEFRPLAVAQAVASITNGTQTLHRFARDASGNFNADPSTGWISSTQRRSYVKGQINDERTERTYLTFDDGSARPRVIDATGQDRVLGVPRPNKPTVTLNVTEEFTPEEASNFLFGDATEQIKAALKSVTPGLTPEPNARFSGTTIFAGPYSAHGLLLPTVSAADPWNLYREITQTRLAELGIDATQLNLVTYEGQTFVPVTSLPAIFRPDAAALTAAIRAIELPPDAGDRAGSQLIPEDQIAGFVERITDRLDPKNFKTQRDRLDALVKEFAQILNGQGAARPNPPTPPVKPSTPEWVDYGGGEGGYSPTRTAEWIAYDQSVAAYNQALENYNQQISGFEQQAGSRTSRLAAIQREAATLTQDIEARSLAAWKSLTESNGLNAVIDDSGGVSDLVGETVQRIIDTRFYVVTFVTDWGEESAPSPVTDLLEPDQNDSVNIQRPTVSSGEAYAVRNIQRWRIYRSNSGSQSSAFQFVDDVPITQTQYVDSKKGAELGEVCPSLTWDEPPYRMDAQFEGFPKPVTGTNPFLRGLVGMPNGIMAGFFDNTVAFCEPYTPYAWPVEYQVVTEFPIVGLGVFGQTLFVGTTANPYFISGADSATMSAQKLDANQACASARSIATIQGGVLYASPDGLCLADGSGVRVVSRAMFTREDWQLLNPASMIGIEHEGVYFLFYSGSGGGCLTFDMAAQKLGRLDQTATAAFVDRTTDTLYLATGSSIVASFGGSARRAGRWRSAVLTMQQQAALAWAKVYGDQSPANPVTLRWFADGQLRYTTQITSLEPVRLPPGRWLEHEVEIESQARVTRVVLASSVAELQSL